MPNQRVPAYARRIALLGVAAYCVTRALAYVPSLRGQPPQEALIAVSGGGALLPGYVVAWGLVALVALWHLRSADLVFPVAAMLGMMTIWGAIWGIGWLFGVAPTGWQTMWTYWGPACVIGAVLFLPHERPRTLAGWVHFTIRPPRGGDASTDPSKAQAGGEA